MKNKLFKSTSILIISAAVLITSCDNDDRITAQDTQDIAEEAVTDSYFQDMDDMAGVAVETPAEEDFNGGRTKNDFTFKIRDNRFVCSGDSIVATFERFNDSSPDVPKGKITVDFGTGCTDLRGNTRKGKVIFTFSGKRFTPGSTLVITGENYEINGVKLSGMRTLTNVQDNVNSAPRYNSVLTNGLAVFDDNSEATRESDITFEWIRAANPLDDMLIIEQSSTASGTTRRGRNYEMSLLEELHYKRFCGIAVDGIKRFVIDEAKEITIDYGDGNCDRTVTITVNGVTRNLNVD